MDNKNNLEKTNFNSIDVFKLFCAVLVVGIHTQPFSQYGILDSAFGLITRIAVPFFFVASSYFFFKKEVTTSKLFKYVKRILILYVFYSMVYLIIDVCLGQFDIKKFLFAFFITGYKHLWFLHSSIVAIVILFFASKNKTALKVLVVFAAVFYVFALLLFTYHSFVSEIDFFDDLLTSSFTKVFYERSWLFYALPYMLVGYSIAKHKIIDTKKAFLLTIVFFALLGVEGAVTIKKLGTDSTILWVFAIPLSYFIFQFMLGAELFNGKNTSWCRNISTSVYCIHPLIITLIEPINIENNLVSFMLVTAISVIFSYFLYVLSNNRKLKFLRYIQ